MKNFTKELKVITIILLSFLLIIIGKTSFASEQNKESVAVINIGAQGLKIEMPLLTSLVTLELERLNIYEVIDKYDVINHMKKNEIKLDISYGKTDLIQIGELMNVNKVLSGSAEKYGNKIIIVFRLIDIKSKKIEKVDVMEYLDQEEDIQLMVRISIHNIFGIENDVNVVDMLSNINLPLSNTKNRVNLSGPRFGLTTTTGNVGKRLQSPKSEGGYDMFPINSLFGYQFEIQYVAAGDFQALFEVIPAFNALESGYIIPSLSLINGFRFNRYGFEFGIGPVFRLVKKAEGFYDEDGNWNLKSDFIDPPTDVYYVNQVDSRGSIELSTGLIIAAGYTFKSGHLNFPINVYISPRKDGTTIGLICGFNIARSKKIETKK